MIILMIMIHVYMYDNDNVIVINDTRTDHSNDAKVREARHSAVPGRRGHGRPRQQDRAPGVCIYNILLDLM